MSSFTHVCFQLCHKDGRRISSGGAHGGETRRYRASHHTILYRATLRNERTAKRFESKTRPPWLPTPASCGWAFPVVFTGYTSCTSWEQKGGIERLCFVSHSHSDIDPYAHSVQAIQPLRLGGGYDGVYYRRDPIFHANFGNRRLGTTLLSGGLPLSGLSFSFLFV